MGLKIFHTADTHIGMKFRQYEGIRDRLVAARMHTLEATVIRANDENCDLYVLAGDLFDGLKVAVRDIEQAAHILGRFSGTVAVLPGNHDYYAAETDELWSRFEKAAGDNLLLLREATTYDLPELSTTLYAGPCHRKHSSTNAIGWIAGTERNSERNFHIGIAHGSIEGLSADLEGNYFPMTRAEFQSLGMHVFLLGHTHRPYPEHPGKSDRFFMPGVAEPDGMDCSHRGGAWLLNLDDSNEIHARYLDSLGQFRFVRETHGVSEQADVAALAEHLGGFDADTTIVDLCITGRLGDDDRDALKALLEDARRDFAHCEVDTAGVGRLIDQGVVDREFAENSFAHRLLSELCSYTDDNEALQLAYELLDEVAA